MILSVDSNGNTCNAATTLAEEPHTTFFCTLLSGHPGYHESGRDVSWGDGPGIKEMVDHPEHYGGADNPYEHVKVMKAWGMVTNAFLYNCTKYLCRAGKKGEALEDLKKARWYLDQEIQRLEDGA